MIANLLVAQLLFLEAEDPERDINLYKTRPVCRSQREWRFTTRCSSSKTITTICIGQCVSNGGLPLAAGTKGKRFPTSPFAYINLPTFRRRVGKSDRRSHYGRRNSADARDDITHVRRTIGQVFAQVELDVERDRIMSPVQAKDTV